MVVLWIILGLIALLALLLVCPVRLEIKYDGGEPVVLVRYLFLAYTAYPQGEKIAEGKVQIYLTELLGRLREKQKEKKRRKTASDKPKIEKKQKSTWQRLREDRGFFGAVRYMIHVIRHSVDTGVYIVQHSSIRMLEVKIAVGGGDAAEVGVRYGQMCAAVYPAVSLLVCAAKRYRNCDVDIRPDFFAANDRYSIKAKLNIIPLWGVSGALRMLWAILKSEVSERQVDALDAIKKQNIASYTNGKQ